MKKPNYKQTLTITLESEDGTESVSISRNDGIHHEDYFWHWFRESWGSLGLSFIKGGLEDEI